jgi:selenide,water dikinase
MAAVRAGAASKAAYDKAVDCMQKLNRSAAEIMAHYDVSACTDITGFGLLAHLLEMCAESVSAKIYVNELPVIPEAVSYAGEYLLTAAGQRNRSHFAKAFAAAGDVNSLPFALQEILFDPQTSGGLLICVNDAQADILLKEIHKNDPEAKIIGQIVSCREQTIEFIRGVKNGNA